jgi:hypothetical protein
VEFERNAVDAYDQVLYRTGTEDVAQNEHVLRVFWLCFGPQDERAYRQSSKHILGATPVDVLEER